MTAGALLVTLTPDRFVPFHRINRDEQWEFVDGDEVELHVIHADGRYDVQTLGAAVHVDGGCLRAARLTGHGRSAMCRRRFTTATGRVEAEFPSAAEILREHPLHERAVRELVA